jgi:hypothetical protein
MSGGSGLILMSIMILFCTLHSVEHDIDELKYEKGD